MSIFDRLINRWSAPFSSYDPAQRVLPDPYEPYMGTYGIPVADPGTPLPLVERGAIHGFWRTQPNLRKVIDFIARNAVVGLHVYERVSDTDRKRITEGPLAALMASPQAGIGPYRFWHSVLSDGLLYDRWAVLVNETDNGTELVQLPSWRLHFEVDSTRRVQAIRFWNGADGKEEHWTDLDLGLLIFDHGYAPATAGMSPIETLRDVLDESAEAVRYRRQVWRNGGRATGYISRPKDTSWTSEQRNRFVKWMRSSFTGDGGNTGGMMLLEDGMTAGSVDTFTPQDAQDLEGRKLSAAEVAAAFHISPELVGARDGTYSNIDAFRQMLYGPSLGPYITAWEEAINSQLTPRYADGRRLYVEANIEAKLRGSFLEQAQVLQSATGSPYLTRNEARARQNLPAVPGGDDLVVPLNVLVGGQASPQDSGTQNLASAEPEAKAPAVKAEVTDRARVEIKAEASETMIKKAEELILNHFARQETAINSALGAKAPDWWDEQRWNAELGDDLYRLAVLVADELGRNTAEAMGFDPDEYDTERTYAFLRAVADQRAGQINGATLKALEAALGAAESGPAVESVWAVAKGQRVGSGSAAILATLAGFALSEAARQLAGDRASKTWVTGANPRPSHAALDGQTVRVGESFSNGMSWPGDSSNADEVAGCNCSLVVTV